MHLSIKLMLNKSFKESIENLVFEVSDIWLFLLICISTLVQVNARSVRCLCPLVTNMENYCDGFKISTGCKRYRDILSSHEFNLFHKKKFMHKLIYFHLFIKQCCIRKITCWQLKFLYNCVFIGGLERPDELLDQPNHNNPWRDGVHSSQYWAGAGRARCLC